MSQMFRAYFYNDPSRIPLQKDSTALEDLQAWIIGLLDEYPDKHGTICLIQEPTIETISRPLGQNYLWSSTRGKL
jgi:hypothetical protein